MSGGEGYVVHFDDGKGSFGFWSTRYETEAEALAAVPAGDTPYNTPYTYSVHKIGPGIEPPEPREWVVVSENGRISPKLTRQESHDRTKEPGDRIARLVFEDDQP